MRNPLVRTLLLLLSLGLLATAGCNRTDPEQAAQAVQADDPGEFCEGHGVYESHCIKCHPKLREKFKALGDYCEEHDFPKSVCPECKIRKPAGAGAPAPASAPDGAAAPAAPAEAAAGGAAAAPAGGAAAQELPVRPAHASADDWCAEHALPESMCTKCHPKLVERYKAAGDWCAEHGYPESVCPRCNPLAPPAGAGSGARLEPGTRIRFKSPEVAMAAGIDVMPAPGCAPGPGIGFAAEIAFDRNRLAEVSTPLAGTVREVLVDLGDVVKQGQALFVLESAQAGDLQAQIRASRERLRAAEADYKRQQGLLEAKVASASEVEASRKELEAARAEVQAHESALRIAGGTAGGSSGRYAVVAPIAGTVVRRPAVLGQHVTAEVSLATVADLASMWARIHVPEWDAAALRLGQPVEVRVDGLPAQSFTGKVTWIASEVDPRTRTVEVRAELPNPDGVLRANQYARATIRVAAPESALVVPRAAIQRLGEESVLFVQTAAGVYEPRVARLGRSEGELVQVVADLRAGDPVVTTGAFLLKTEISKENIGAGCCEVEEPGSERE